MMAGTPPPAWKPLAAVPRGTAWNLHREREVEFADQVLAKSCSTAAWPRTTRSAAGGRTWAM